MTRTLAAPVLMLALLLAACASHRTVTTSFAPSNNVTAGTPVFLGGARVGEVTAVNRTPAAVNAELALDPEVTAGLRAGSAALLTRLDGAPAIELFNNRSGTASLKEGDALTGLDSPLALAAWQFGEAMGTGARSMEEIAGAVNRWFQSEDWQRQRELMDERLSELESELGRSWEEAREAYSAYLRSLEEESEEAREQAREAFAELVRQLRQDLSRLRREGNEQLIEPLERLLEELERALETEPRMERA